MPEAGVDWNVKGLIERLTKLYFQKPILSTRQIAATLAREYGYRFTRNSIIGKCHRLKFKPRPDAPKNNNPPAPDPTPKPRVRSPRLIQIDAPIAPRLQPRQLRQTHNLVPFLQLQPDECKYPLGDHPNIRFCAQPRFEDYPYCLDHCKTAFNTPYQAWKQL